MDKYLKKWIKIWNFGQHEKVDILYENADRFNFENFQILNI